MLAELTDVLYLTLNLGQECGLQDWLEAAFLVKHSDNMRKQLLGATRTLQNTENCELSNFEQFCFSKTILTRKIHFFWDFWLGAFQNSVTTAKGEFQKKKAVIHM